MSNDTQRLMTELMEKAMAARMMAALVKKEVEATKVEAEVAETAVESMKNEITNLLDMGTAAAKAAAAWARQAVAVARDVLNNSVPAGGPIFANAAAMAEVKKDVEWSVERAKTHAQEAIDKVQMVKQLLTGRTSIEETPTTGEDNSYYNNAGVKDKKRRTKKFKRCKRKCIKSKKPKRPKSKRRSRLRK